MDPGMAGASGRLRLLSHGNAHLAELPRDKSTSVLLILPVSAAARKILRIR
jgi:hypothetical protein